CILSTAVLTLCWATPPPGHVKKPDNDKDPPKYEFGYDVQDGKGGRQGHLEARDGVHALGMYYVNLPDGSEQRVRYFTDDWGYHPLVSYTSSTNSGSTKTHFALGEKAVKALTSTKEAPKIPDIGGAIRSSLKIPEDLSGVEENKEENLKLKPGKLSSKVTSTESSDSKLKSSIHEVSSTVKTVDQSDVSEVNNLIDTGDKVSGKYELVSPVYSSSSISNVPFGSSSQQGHEEIVNSKETGSTSYQLVDIGSASSKSGSSVSVSHSPLFLQLVSEANNIESGKSADYRSGRKQKVTSYAHNLNSGLNFGDKIPRTGAHSNQLTSSVGQLQNEIYKNDKPIIQVTSTPSPQIYSSLRPIIVAEIKQHSTIRPIIVSPFSPTPTPTKIHNIPPTVSSIGDTEQSNLIVSQDAKGEYFSETSQASKNIDVSSEKSGIKSQSNTRPILLSYSTSGSREGLTRHSAFVPVQNDRLPYAQPLTYTTPSSVAILIPQDTSSLSSNSQDVSSDSVQQNYIPQAQPLIYSTTSQFSESHFPNVAHSSSESQIKSSTATKQEDSVEYAQPLVYTTPSPHLISHSEDASNPSIKQEGSSHYIVTSNNGHSGQLQSPAVDISSSDNRNSEYHYSTPAPKHVSLSQEKETQSTGFEEQSQQQSFVTVNAVNTGHVVNQYSNQSPRYLSHSLNPTSFSESNLVPRSQKSEVGTVGNENSVYVIANGIQSTTPRPIIKLSETRLEGGVSGGYVASSTPVPVFLNSHPSPGVATLASSILAPIQAGVSINSDSQQSESETITPLSTPQPPPVTEKVDDIPQRKTVVEIQKAISIDFNELATKANEERQKTIFIAPVSHPSVEGKNQDGGKVKQIQVNDVQQLTDIRNLNIIQYGYSQPLLGIQTAYIQPLSVQSDAQYSYNPQIFEPQKLTNSDKYQHDVYSGLQYGISGQFSESEKHEYPKKVQSETTEHQHQQTAIETEEYQHKQPLITLYTDNSNQGQHETDSLKQQVITTYNEQSDSGERHIFSKLQLPVATQVHTGYSQQLIQNDHIQSSQPVGHHVYHVPVQFHQQIEFQEPLTHISQDSNYQKPIIISQQGGNDQTNHNQQLIISQFNQEAVEGNTQNSKITDQTTNQVKPAYNKNPTEIEEQLQKEYNHQLEEEDKQEQAKLSSKINESLKQITVNYQHAVEDEKHINPTLQSFVNEYILSEQHTNSIPFYQQTKLPEDGKRIPEEQTKIIEVEKPVPVHHTKVIEKPVPVPHAVPVEVTKLVAVEKPVPYPQPYAVPHPYPLPYAVPHPIGVPVPHLVPYPHVVTLPYKEFHPVYIQGKPHKHDSVNLRYQVQNFVKDTPLPIIMKAIQHHGGRYGYPVTVKNQYHHASKIPETFYLSPPPLKSSGRGRGPPRSKNHDRLRTLCIEYGFKPPLIPSKQIDGIPPSAYGPPTKE
ncbi:hypothetical protein L9F63_019186, partial [Diploptera punctata]